MLDRHALKWLDPALQGLARRLVALGWKADWVTCVGFAIGLSAAVAIGCGQYAAGIALLLLSRLADGLDGAIARCLGPTDRGAYLDITLDFAVYAAIPLGFAFADPNINALPAAVLLATFFGTGASFLAFAVLAERRGLRSTDYPGKGLYYLGGLTEASETIFCFVLMCLMPGYFGPLAYGFAALCVLSFGARVVAGWRMLGAAP